MTLDIKPHHRFCVQLKSVHDTFFTCLTKFSHVPYNSYFVLTGLDGSITILPRKSDQNVGMLVNVGSEEPLSPKKVI